MSEGKAETPSEVVAKANETASHVDVKGRLITVKPLNALQSYRLAKVLGGAATPASSDMATLAAQVVKIDAQPIAFPVNERDIEFLIQQLDFEGLIAAGIALGKLVPKDDKEIEDRRQAEIEASKN